MSKKINNLDELRLQKEALKKEVAEMEDLLKFKNKAKSLSEFTNGYSDRFIKEGVDNNGNSKTVLQKDAIIKSLSSSVRDSVANRDNIVGVANKAMNAGVVDDILQLGVSTLLAGFARKQMKSKSIGKKAFGYALIYLAPYAIKLAAKKATEVRRKKSISSLEKII